MLARVRGGYTCVPWGGVKQVVFKNFANFLLLILNDVAAEIA
jgi:hypothetical protein